MKILHLSDTHGLHHWLRDLPEADVVVHSGDFTMNGSEEETIDFINWFCDLPHPHKIFICGNHDECLFGAILSGLDSDVHYLCNSGVEIDGVKFYGVPMFMDDCISNRQNEYYAQIPSDTNVLITHQPPYGIFDFDEDIHYGSEELLTSLVMINPRLHLFGHIHAQYGTTTNGITLFSNGSIMESNYLSLRIPNIIDLPLLCNCSAVTPR